MKIVFITLAVLLIIPILLNPSLKNFKENAPTLLELQKEIDLHPYLFAKVKKDIDYKILHNYLIFSVFEFQYVRVEKKRTDSNGYIDKYGTFNHVDNLIQRKYYGILNNFFEAK